MKKERSLTDNDLYESRFHDKERQANRRFFFAAAIFIWVFVFLLSCWHAAFGGVQVSGTSMLKTLPHGKYLLMRYHRDGDELERGSVIVVSVEHYPEVQAYNEKQPEGKETKLLIKRLIALEGDTVRCKDGQLSVRYAGETEFTPLEEPYAYYTNRWDYDFEEDYVVGEGEIFFLGDNRNSSVDSRYQENDEKTGAMGSHLSVLYKETDVYGVVPDWAIEHQDVLERIFFWRELLEDKTK